MEDSWKALWFTILPFDNGQQQQLFAPDLELLLKCEAGVCVTECDNFAGTSYTAFCRALIYTNACRKRLIFHLFSLSVRKTACVLMFLIPVGILRIIHLHSINVLSILYQLLRLITLGITLTVTALPLSFEGTNKRGFNIHKRKNLLMHWKVDTRWPLTFGGLAFIRGWP